MKKLLSEISIAYMNVLMKNSEIAQKIQAKGKEGKSYAICTICDDGIVVLGETRYKFWNQLVGCQVKLPFTSWALAVWDALVCLSKAANATAIEEGLSVEIAKKAQREDKYNWVVNRLFEVFEHVCNNRNGGASLEGDQRKSGSSVVVSQAQPASDTVVNVVLPNMRRTFRFPDATGQAFLDVEMGVVGLGVSKDTKF